MNSILRIATDFYSIHGDWCFKIDINCDQFPGYSMGTIGVYQTIKIVLCQNNILAVSEGILLFVQGFKNKNWKFNWFVLKFNFHI